MRMTIHNGRAGKNGVYSPKHNDRQFDISSAEHIDPERMPGNIYWNWTGENVSFEDAEKAFYEEHCREYLDAVNRRHKEQRHPERVRDMDAYRTARQLAEMNQKARRELKEVKKQLEVYKPYLTKAEQRELQEMLEREQDGFELE